MRPRAEETRVYIETKDGIKDGIPLKGMTYQQLFKEHEDAEALWVLPPGWREPFRVPWNLGAFGRYRPPARRGGEKRGSKGEKHAS